jgi:hypothetical protein
MDIKISEGTELGAEDGWLTDAPIDAICRPIIDYHRAQQEKDTSLLSSSICDIVYRVYSAQSDRFVDWEPWTRLTRERILSNFGNAFENPDYYYENRIECTHIKLNGKEAMVRVIESGRSWKNREWDNVEVLWHTTPVDELTWNIAGHIHHLNRE